mmetsp:Transcript_15265/g.38059  ORF Transcript_15265/g.38059 Transcript_15265/m.38059 type:complete len:201 (-) Transcript_15265:124-726(-)
MHCGREGRARLLRARLRAARVQGPCRWLGLWGRMTRPPQAAAATWLQARRGRRTSRADSSHLLLPVAAEVHVQGVVKRVRASVQPLRLQLTGAGAGGGRVHQHHAVRRGGGRTRAAPGGQQPARHRLQGGLLVHEPRAEQLRVGAGVQRLHVRDCWQRLGGRGLHVRAAGVTAAVAGRALGAGVEARLRGVVRALGRGGE